METASWFEIWSSPYPVKHTGIFLKISFLYRTWRHYLNLPQTFLQVSWMKLQKLQKSIFYERFHFLMHLKEWVASRIVTIYLLFLNFLSILVKVDEILFGHKGDLCCFRVGQKYFFFVIFAKLIFFTKNHN